MDNVSVMIVEDEMLVAMDLRQMLEHLGHEVVKIAATGEDAIGAVKQFSPELIFMDVHLHGLMDGIEAAEKIRENSHVPVIYLTAFADDDTVKRAKVTGPYGYITKPFTEKEIRSTIDITVYRFRMEQKLNQTRKLLDATFSSIQDAILTTDIDLNIILANKQACLLTGVNSDEKCPLEEVVRFCRDDQFVDIETFLENAFDQKMQKSAYTVFFPRTLRKTMMKISVSSIFSDDISVINHVFVFFDISEELKSQQTRNHLASIVEMSQDAIFTLGSDGRILTWNRGAEKILGYLSEDIIGKNISALIPSSVPNEMPGALDEIKATKKLPVFDFKLLALDGTIRIMSISLSLLRDNDSNEPVISVIARDQTETKELEREVLEIGNMERTRIGQDLHDSLGQHLTGVSLKLKAFEMGMGTKLEGKNAEILADIRKLVQEAISQTRDLSHVLMPVLLIQDGIGTALEELASFCCTHYNIKAICDIDPRLPILDFQVSLEVYRIAQEAVNNIGRHSSARNAWISLRREDQECLLAISDDGTGVDRPDPSGHGLKLMKYRADIIDGRFSTDTSWTKGFSVYVRFPLKEHKE